MNNRGTHVRLYKPCRGFAKRFSRIKAQQIPYQWQTCQTRSRRHVPKLIQFNQLIYNQQESNSEENVSKRAVLQDLHFGNNRCRRLGARTQSHPGAGPRKYKYGANAAFQVILPGDVSLLNHALKRCRYQNLAASYFGCKAAFFAAFGREYSQLFIVLLCLLAAMSCDKYSVSISLIQAGLFFIFVGLHDKVSFNASVIIRSRLCCGCGRRQWYLFLMNLSKTIYQNNFRMMSAYNLWFKRIELVS